MAAKLRSKRYQEQTFLKQWLIDNQIGKYTKNYPTRRRFHNTDFLRHMPRYSSPSAHRAMQQYYTSPHR